ncbi:DUF6273 domain-containing protein [Desulfitobacterium sp.]|uniref:DUF6273 domain-containing protein n=1 Tax=Desulfitobacterium sp. TaxID=49981 RepID=UPI002B1F33FE|nr:DUF6273 domain-containing protein [Desulfitobacterium sp.]MEA4901841.1 DUF6273 domain-containing protein [Desulfitobacterium sp.]
MAQQIINLPVGAKVKDTTSMLYGKPLIFQIADKNHAGYPANSVTLITERIVKIMCFDAIEATNSDSNRKSYGNNRYAFANLRQWLNKTGTNWYTAQHGADAPPSAANVWDSKNPYDAVAGFLTGFSLNFRTAILQTTLTVAKATVDGGGSETVTDGVFLLSKAEVGLGAENGITEGSLLALFNTNNSSRLCMPTAEAVSNSNYTNSSLSASQNWYWWLRSPYAATSYNVRLVYSDGSETYGNAYYGTHGLRPALNLPSNILVSDSADADGAYVIQWNQPPTKPPSMTVPDTIKSGKNATITWTASTDPDGNPISYDLDVSVNGGGYSNIYTGSGLTYNHAITVAMNSVKYRVRAKDSVGDYSDYLYSDTRTVIHNIAPGISGSDSDLGIITAPPTTKFTVSKPDATGNVRVDITLDGTTVQTTNPVELEQEYTYSMTPAQFYALKSGQHTLQIKATDYYGDSTTRTITFRRSVVKIDLKTAPIQTDAKPEKILISLQYYAAAGDVQVRVCNNALDASPAWETANVGLKHIFSNNTKTAEKWAVGVWVTISPSTAYPQVYCNGLNGSYI